MDWLSQFGWITFFGILSCIAIAETAPPTVLVWGDSLSAAYGMPLEQGWVARLQQRLGPRYRVVNGSQSGETTGGGLARLPAALQRETPEIVIIELGANDGLRGLPVTEIQENLTRMITLIRQAGAQPVLLGMRMPPNLGPVYTARYEKVFTQVAQATQTPLLPFFLEGIAQDFNLIQTDGLHPTAAAQGRLLDNVWSVLQPLLERSGAS